ncbi:FAD/NAD(P)-binding protein [Pedobacter aquatilis]|uniref:FAD/NAD(P)-binding protein n=1 Tax=Pedobacter aquatilis TaxID=351343 RepID=UPI00292EB4EB|nr:FAD/NAD(P)-binding protein [Pedobacter aquatilis]
MEKAQEQHTIALIGGGPTALLTFKSLLNQNETNISITVYERKQLLGAGMPYSRDGALDEHITNVSGNEIPDLLEPVSDWISSEHKHTLNRFDLNADKFNKYKVLLRLLFGRYLADQFAGLIKKAKDKQIQVNIRYGSEVTDIIDAPELSMTKVVCGESVELFDKVIICSGHHWPTKNEGIVEGYFDSPYPPEKLAHRTNHEVAIRGSSLTAIDAIRTLARANGKFIKNPDGGIEYLLDENSADFRMLMHSRSGLLPAVRFHLEDSHLSKDAVLSNEEVKAVIGKNGGFLPLDYVFMRNFLEPLEKSDPEFYAKIKNLSIEEFVEKMMHTRHEHSAFELLAIEMDEAERSIRKRESVNWKEMLAVLSFAMNYPAKHFSAEDMARLKKHLMPLISVVIAFAPQGSVHELMALHRAGLLDIVSVGEKADVSVNDESKIFYTYEDENKEEVSVQYETFVDAIGQPHLELKDLPYPGLIESGTVAHAMLMFQDQQAAEVLHKNGDSKVIRFADGRYYQLVPGIAINDSFQILDTYGAANERIFMLAVPYIGGYNPDFSGLDFGEAASKRVVEAIFNLNQATTPEAA